MSVDKISGLMIYIDEPKMSYLQDWIEAFKNSEFFNLRFFELTKISYNDIVKLSRQLSNDEFVIFHHSVLRTSYNIKIFKKFLPLFRDRKFKLLTFIGDEVNLHNSPLSEKINILKEMKPDFICSQLLKEAADYLYSDTRSTVIEMPHALNEKVFISYKDVKLREYDIAAISVPYPIYLGDDEREKIFNYFVSKSKKYDLLCNIIKTEDLIDKRRLSREEWVSFLNNTKGTIATEAGSYYLDKQDTLIMDIIDYLQANIVNKKVIRSDSFVKKIYDLIPVSKTIKIKIKKYLLKKVNFLTTDSDILFDYNFYPKIYEKFFAKRQKPHYYGKAISSRHFDAIGTKTVQILFEGRYNDILKPDEHYICLKKDFSNIDEVIEKFKDTDFCIKIANDAYSYILENHTYTHRIKTLYEKIRTITIKS